MNRIIIENLAERLRTAYEQKIPCAPIREVIGTEDIATAYAIQAINNDRLIAAGARVVGRKIGLTSKVVQQQLGVNQPDFGLLLNTMEVLNNDSISVKALMQPKVEAEIAFVLGKDLPDYPVTATELMRAVDYVVGSIEIVGSRIENWNIKITDTVADNASASHFVVGHRPYKLENVDIIGCKMQLSKNGKVVSDGSGAACLGSPLNATLWLANTMANLRTPLRAGEVILSGALGAMASVAASDTFVASFSGLGQVCVHFSE
jgi:2-keto-4-pentenoate hydratase